MQGKLRRARLLELHRAREYGERWTGVWRLRLLRGGVADQTVIIGVQYNDQAVQCTWEGDNTILSLQAGRSLVAAYADALKSKPQPGGTAYLNELPAVLTATCGGSNPVSLDSVDRAWATVAANVVKKAHDAYEGFLKAGKGKEEALELCSQERFVAAKVHTAGYLFRQFRLALAELAKKEPQENGVVATLEKVCLLYGAWGVEENAQYFLQYGFYKPDQVDALSKEVTALCAELRTCAVSLVDSFNFSDHIVSDTYPEPSRCLHWLTVFSLSSQINSPLGVYSGDVYKTYFDRVRAANPHEAVHPYFDRLIKPLLERESLELDDADEMQLDDEIDEIRADREEAKAAKA